MGQTSGSISLFGSDFYLLSLPCIANTYAYHLPVPALTLARPLRIALVLSVLIAPSALTVLAAWLFQMLFMHLLKSQAP